jgi:hypothetical protein
MKTQLAIVVLMVIALASGCVGESSDLSASDSESPTATSTSSGNRTTSPSATANNTTSSPNMTMPNSPPTANLTTNLTNMTGQAPVNVTFMLNGTDPDNDTLNWTLDFGDGNTTNGTEIPTNVTYEYTQNGTYNVTLNVTDGNLSANSTIMINITSGGGGASFTDTASLPCTQCSVAGANTGVGFRLGESGLDSVFFELTPELAGLPFEATSSGTDPDLSFREDCDGGAAVGDGFAEEGPEHGTVPEGALCVLLWEFEESGSEITIVIGTAPPAAEE